MVNRWPSTGPTTISSIELGLWPHTEDEYPPVMEARCSKELLEHLEHLHETNDLFGNVAK